MHISRFIKQKPYEHVIHTLHRHPFTFLPKVLLFILLSLIPVGAFLMIQGVLPWILTNETGFALLVLFGGTYYLGILALLFTEFIIYYLDVWIVTNDRIVDVEQLSLFSRTISELELHNIQDVTSEIHGFFPTLFNYGSLTVKTASINANIIFYDIHRPNKIREDLIRLADEDRKFHILNANKTPAKP